MAELVKYLSLKNKKINSKNENDVDASILYTTDEESDSSSLSTDDECCESLPILYDTLKLVIDNGKNVFKLINSPKQDFIEWHRNDSIKIMDYIEKYKNPLVTFEGKDPKKIKVFIEPFGENVTIEELEQRLMVTFLRTIRYYSFIFDAEIDTPDFRLTLIKIGDHIKRRIMTITKELDKRNLRDVYRSLALNQEKTFPNEGRNRARLRDFLDYPQEVYEEIVKP